MTIERGPGFTGFFVKPANFVPFEGGDLLPEASIGRGSWRLRRNGCVGGWLLEEMNLS